MIEKELDMTIWKEWLRKSSAANIRKSRLLHEAEELIFDILASLPPEYSDPFKDRVIQHLDAHRDAISDAT